MVNKYYVYGYYHPITEELFYVGKGIARRAWNHLCPSNLNYRKTYFINTINKIKEEYNINPIVKILHDKLTEEKALNIEQNLIKKYGRKAFDKDGILTNMSTGGESGATGHKWSVAARLKMSNSRKGTPHTSEHSDKISKALLGRPHTTERKRKISEALKGRTLSKEHKEKLKHHNHSNPTTTWKVRGPDGSIYITPNLPEFCKNHNLSYTAIYKNRNKPIIRGIAKGWQTLEKYYSKELNHVK